jgi:TusA-related sulfurtransferase
VFVAGTLFSFPTQVSESGSLTVLILCWIGLSFTLYFTTMFSNPGWVSKSEHTPVPLLEVVVTAADERAGQELEVATDDDHSDDTEPLFAREKKNAAYEAVHAEEDDTVVGQDGEEDRVSVARARVLALTRDKRFCLPCRTMKPARGKHCYTCGRCVARFDHHCPFMGSCIGGKNHRYAKSCLSVDGNLLLLLCSSLDLVTVLLTLLILSHTTLKFIDGLWHFYGYKVSCSSLSFPS